MRRDLNTVVLTVVVSLALVACSPGDDGDVTGAAATSVATSIPLPSTTSSTTSSTTTTGSVPPDERALGLCATPTSVVLGQVANRSLDEASGLVASRRHRDVIWTHNDGADGAGLFALGTDGADLGFHPILLDGVVDVEDIAMVPGPTGDDILLADIGDNAANRPSVRILRVAEPDPLEPDPITDIEVLEFVYPDRPHNAEVLLVDDANDRIVIVTKEQGQVDGLPPEFGPTASSFVFEGPLDGHAGEPVELSAAGMLDAPLLAAGTTADRPHPATMLGIGGLPTGGDVSADGELIALRTYETVWLWSRQQGRSVAESLAADPCQAPAASEPQGEAVAFRDGSLITVSEGITPDLYELRP